MALGRPIQDLTKDFNSSYNITLDLSGWDKTTIQVIAPLLGTRIHVYGTNDGGQLQSVRDGSAQNATNFQTMQVVNLATGNAQTTITAAGLYRATVDAQYLKLLGEPADTPTNVYRLLLFNSKVS